MKRDMKPHALLLTDQIPPARRVTGTVDALIVQESDIPSIWSQIMSCDNKMIAHFNMSAVIP